MRDHDLTILALDPSTDVTGVAVMGFAKNGVPTLFRAAHYEAHCSTLPLLGKAAKGDKDGLPSFNEMLHRSRDTRRWLNGFVAELPWAVDLVAFEMPPHRGFGATNALLIAVGMYLTLEDGLLAHLPVVPVAVSTAKAVWGGNTRDAGGTKELKRRVCVWANQTFDAPFDGKGGEAEADAASVGCGAWRIWSRREAVIDARQSQMVLLGEGSRKKPKVVGPSRTGAGGAEWEKVK